MAAQNRRVLVVVKDHDQRLQLSSLLARHGYAVNAVADVPMAHTLLRSEPPDLVIFDAALLASGVEDLCRTMRGDSERQRLPMLVVGQRPGAVERQGALDAGADEFLESTASDGELLALADELVRIRDAADHLDVGEESVVRAFSQKSSPK